MIDEPAVEQIFSTPVYHATVNPEKFDSIQKQIRGGLEKTDFKYKTKDWGQTHYLSDPEFNEHFLEKHECNALIEELFVHLINFHSTFTGPNGAISPKYSPDSLSLVDSWVALFKKGDYGHIHDHLGNAISGVYYHQTKGSDGQIFFDPWHVWQSRVHVTPHDGMLLMFPSQLRHGITTNTTDSTRISLSFNFA